MAIVAPMPKVLLVADASWVFNEVSAALSLGDWEIEELSDPRQVVEMARSTHPYAVIVDMQVGSMGGMAVIRSIRGEIDPAQRPLTVLLLDRSADRFIAKRSGADASVLKPVDPGELRTALGSRNQTRALFDEEE
jgi:DNA-binding response OmpR family regulator